MIPTPRIDEYETDSVWTRYEPAKARKLELKEKGFRVKIVTNTFGECVVYRKNVAVIDARRRNV